MWRKGVWDTWRVSGDYLSCHHGAWDTGRGNYVELELIFFLFSSWKFCFNLAGNPEITSENDINIEIIIPRLRGPWRKNEECKTIPLPCFYPSHQNPLDHQSVYYAPSVIQFVEEPGECGGYFNYSPTKYQQGMASTKTGILNMFRWIYVSQHFYLWAAWVLHFLTLDLLSPPITRSLQLIKTTTMF